MAGRWHHKTTVPFLKQGKDTTRSNFSREERSKIGILIREALQNPLDGRRDGWTGAVQVLMRNLEPGEFDAAYLDSLFDADFRARLAISSGVTLPSAGTCCVFTIEDFGTKGLVGDVENYDADGPDQNWNAFWHREGEGAKGKASNGGAGQGKVTYFQHSEASAIYGLTVRASDNRRLLMGTAAFVRDYQFTDGSKYYRSAYWTTSDVAPLPEEQPAELDRFCKAFGLTRDSSTSGLSLAIPFAKAFDHREAVRSVILDFYMPIAAERLEVIVGGVRLSSKTIDAIADRFIPDDDAAAIGSSFTKGFRTFARGVILDPSTLATLRAGWNKDRVIPAEAFPDGGLEALREKLAKGERIAVRFPLLIKRKSGEQMNTTFDVFIEAPEDLGRNEEAFVRRDLLIGSESHITAGAFVQKTRSITWIQDKDLSDFLLSAEEPTHLRWNASLARDKGDYMSPDVALRSIRQAVPRLLAVLLKGSEKKDVKSLARYFSRPATDPTKRPGDGGKSKDKDVVTPAPSTPPPPVRKPFRLQPDGTTMRVLRNGPHAFDGVAFPVSAVLELAYEGLDLDPFEAYDPYDFDVGQTHVYPISVRGCSVASRAGNRIEIEVSEPEFVFEVGGFDPNTRLRARLNYSLGAGGTAVETEE